MASINNSLFSYLIAPTGNFVGETGATSLSEALEWNTTLTELDLGSEYKRTKDTQMTFINNPLFSFLLISTANEIGDTGATSLSEALKSNTTLMKLSLWGEDKRKKTHKWHPSTIHSFHFSSKQATGLNAMEKQH